MVCKPKLKHYTERLYVIDVRIYSVYRLDNKKRVGNEVNVVDYWLLVSKVRVFSRKKKKKTC